MGGGRGKAVKGTLDDDGIGLEQEDEDKAHQCGDSRHRELSGGEEEEDHREIDYDGGEIPGRIEYVQFHRQLQGRWREPGRAG